MNFQTIIVAMILLGALFYIGKNVWRKTKSFSGKSSCGTGDCGCGIKSTGAKSFASIKK